ncbi:histone-lysine N-methyltransferase SETD1A-like [Papaver somniferum]|uniref:histone-lysine N-methyltransferase SETD1A-like n=1 Tax=Papaver somniferum TaxID=3469 RepID=UPI000E702F70|nr:histone-lysine N-methyltransferase SETD1A-like [Papaver somniferum]
MESTAADKEVKRKHGELDESSSSCSKRIRKFEEESVQDENPESGVGTIGDDGADKESLSVLKRKHESSSSLDDDDELAETSDSDSSKRTRTYEEGIVKDEDQELAESSSTLQHQEDKKEDQEMDNITTETECGFYVNFVSDDEKVMMGSMTGSAERDESTQSSNESEDWVEELTTGFINLSIIKRKW